MKVQRISPLPVARQTAKPAMAEPAKPQAPVRRVGDFGQYLQDQGRTMACGTTSLAMLLSFWKGQPGATTHEQIDRQIRHFGLTTMPDALRKYAESQGMRAVVRNNSTLEDLTKLLDQGVPTLVLYDRVPDGKDLGLHYVVAVGYDRDASGKVSAMRIADPLGGKLTTLPIAEFQERWDDLQLLSQNIRMSNVMIPMVPQGEVGIRDANGVVRPSSAIALPAPQSVGWMASFATKLFNAANTVGRWVDALRERF